MFHKKVPKKGTPNPRLTGRAGIYSSRNHFVHRDKPIAGMSFNQLRFYGSINFSNSTLIVESLKLICNTNIIIRFFNSTTR